MVFRFLTGGVERMQVFRAEKDDDAFHRVVEETLRVVSRRSNLCLLLDAERLAFRLMAGT